MTMIAPHSVEAAAVQPDLSATLAAGRLPDAPLSMPTQVLEVKRAPFALARALFAGPLRPAGT